MSVNMSVNDFNNSGFILFSITDDMIDISEDELKEESEKKREEE